MTEAKDTEMSYEEIEKHLDDDWDGLDTIGAIGFAVEAQAEITGKIMYEEGKKAGRKAFVKWLERYSRRWQGISMNDQLAGREPTKMITIEIEEQVWQRQI